MYSFTFAHEPSVKSTSISSNSNNCKITEACRFLCHIITTVTHICWKSKTYSEKVLVTKNNTLMSANSFINIYVS